MLLGVYAVNFLLDVVLIVVNLIAALLMLWGLRSEQPGLLLPFIVTQVKKLR